jgi:hypothetical protein
MTFKERVSENISGINTLKAYVVEEIIFSRCYIQALYSFLYRQAVGWPERPAECGRFLSFFLACR